MEFHLISLLYFSLRSKENIKIAEVQLQNEGHSDTEDSCAVLAKYFVSMCYDTGSTTGAGTSFFFYCLFNMYWDKIGAVR